MKGRVKRGCVSAWEGVRKEGGQYTTCNPNPSPAFGMRTYLTQFCPHWLHQQLHQLGRCETLVVSSSLSPQWPPTFRYGTRGESRDRDRGRPLPGRCETLIGRQTHLWWSPFH